MMNLVDGGVPVISRCKKITPVGCWVSLALCSVGAVLFSLPPSTVQAAGAPAFLFDATKTLDSLTPRAARKVAPNFTLTDNNGKIVTLSNYKGKVVLLDFWATWCGGCKLEIPWYMGFDRKYRNQGLAVIGVSMDEDGWKAVKPFLAKKRDAETGGNIAMQYPIVLGSDSLGKQFGLTSMPMTLLIDKDGKIAVSHTGVVDKDNFERNIRALLN
jgi:peroxiredoxin